jgi:AcrR family transcriptional regulator
MSEALPRQTLHKRVSEAILDGAARIFAIQGEQANMNDVATAAGVARATVYRYFPNREALLEALAQATVSDVDARLASARINEVAPEEGIARAVRALAPSYSWRASDCDPPRSGSSAASRSRCASCSSGVRPTATSETTSQARALQRR